MTIRAQYDADLAALKTAVAEMGGCAADAVEAALEALCTADADAAAAVIKGDGRINSMQRDIEHRCMTLRRPCRRHRRDHPPPCGLPQGGRPCCKRRHSDGPEGPQNAP